MNIKHFSKNKLFSQSRIFRFFFSYTHEQLFVALFIIIPLIQKNKVFTKNFIKKSKNSLYFLVKFLV